MSDNAASLTARIYGLLAQAIEPIERRKQIEELISEALDRTRRTFESRIAALEELAHEPFDFTDMIMRLEALEQRPAPLINVGGISHG